MSTISFRVIGTPAPQGSKAYRGHSQSGRAILVEQSKKVKPWRQDVSMAAICARRGMEAMDGPICVGIKFFLPRPKSSPKRRLFPDCRPDLDKLARSTLDALKTAGLYHDDGQVVNLCAQKFFAVDGEPLGAQITVYQAVSA